MTRIGRFVLLYLFCICFVNLILSQNVPEDLGDALFLTPYIENGDIEFGREVARVTPLAGDVQSYSGLFTVNESCNSNMFFWYFPAEEDQETTPVILWLQGGPGTSSMFGLLELNGAFYFEKDGTPKTRELYWSQKFHVIYIDNPVGAGFSFTGSDDCYARDQARVGEDLYSAVFQFFEMFHELKGRDFFIAGESYAGKYIPALAYTIHTKNLVNEVQINLKGIAIGNGLIDPESMMKYSDYFYQIGLFDSHQREEFSHIEDEIVTNIQEENFAKATDLYQKMILGSFVKDGTYFKQITGFSLIYNILHNKNYSPFGNMKIYLKKNKMKQILHVGNLRFQTDKKVERFLYEEITQSVKPWFEVVLENYRVLMYSGQLDIIVPYPCTVSFLKSLDWSGAELYEAAERKKWYLGSELAGYWKTSQNLLEVLIRNTGHMVPADQPVYALELLTRFVYDKPL